MESTIIELYRLEGIAQNLYSNCSKEFFQAGKQRLSGNTKRQSDSEEVGVMKHENEQQKLLLAKLDVPRSTFYRRNRQQAGWVKR